MAKFERKFGFPGIIGVIDGTHIPIVKPMNNGNSYINRKGFPSVLLQGVCDDKKLFIDTFCGIPGSVHDARLYQMSHLYQDIECGNVEFPNNGHMIGDLAYPLSKTLLVGYKRTVNLTNRQKNFNRKLSAPRAIIENAFGYLKCRFRKLKQIETVRLDRTVLLITAGCILHNLCILNGDVPDDIVDNWELHEILQEQQFNIDLDEGNALQRNREAWQKREMIANLLPINTR